MLCVLSVAAGVYVGDPRFVNHILEVACRVHRHLQWGLCSLCYVWNLSLKVSKEGVHHPYASLFVQPVYKNVWGCTSTHDPKHMVRRWIVTCVPDWGCAHNL